MQTAFVTKLSATVTDQYGNLVPGATVVFAAPSSGPSGAFANSTATDSEFTNASGVATATVFTANIFAGTYTVGASTSGVANPANFSLTNLSSLGTTANEIYVHNLYAVLFNRLPDSGASYWITQLTNGESAATVVQTFEGTTEYLTDVVANIYEHYLGHAPDSGGSQYWVGQLAGGATIETVTAAILASPEYFAKGGSNTNMAFVQNLYHDVLGRTGSPTDVASWVSALSGGTTRMQVALFFLTTTEYRANLIDSYYSQFLRRPADGGGLDYYLGQLGSGVSDQTVLAAIFGSAEGYAKWS